MSNGKTIFGLLSGQERLRGPCLSIPGPLKRIVATTSLPESSLDWLWAGVPRGNAAVAGAATLRTKIADLAVGLPVVTTVRGFAADMSLRVIAVLPVPVTAAPLPSGAVACVRYL
jgi:hypothetical protein